MRTQAEGSIAGITLLCRVLVLFALWPQAAIYAADPHTHISQYAHSVWQVRDGWFPGSPTAVTQTKDGYMWIGTSSGLIRYDGENFDVFQPSGGQGLLSPLILTLLGAQDGSLWVGDGSGVDHLQSGQIRNYGEHRGRVNAILEGRDGAIWYARTRFPDQDGPLCRIGKEENRCFGRKERLAAPLGASMMQDHNGDLWVGGSNSLSQWNPVASKDFSSELHGDNLLTGIQAMAEARDGTIYLGSPVGHQGGGLQQLIGGHIQEVLRPGLEGRKIGVTALLEDREGALWVGTYADGIYRLYQNSVEHYRRSDGLSSDAVNNIFEDSEGTVWVATNGGLDNFRDLRVLSFTVTEGLSMDSISGIAVAQNDTLWIGNQDSVDLLSKGVVRKLQGFPTAGHVTSVLTDHQGRDWVGISNGLYLYDAGHFREVRKANGDPAGLIVSITEDTAHTIWATSLVQGPSLIRVAKDKAVEETLAPQPPGLHLVRADTAHGIWLSYADGQLRHLADGRLSGCKVDLGRGRFKEIVPVNDDEVLAITTFALQACRHGRVQTMDSRNGLPDTRYFTGLFDLNGNLWLMTARGLLRIPKDQFGSWWKHPDSTVRFTLFDSYDGVQPSEGIFDSKAVVTSDGKLWFAGEVGLNMIDPQSQTPIMLPPPVTIEGLTANHQVHPVSAAVSLPPLTPDIEIHYAALSYVSPGKIRFRYQLNGYSSDWQDPGSRRTAYFENLKPGTYHFRVIAGNGDAWNQQGATLTFTIAPYWYQTKRALVGFVLALLLAAWTIYRLRVRSIARSINARFEERLAERTRVARELHDTFLQTVQGSKMVADDALAEGTDDTRRTALVKLSTWLGQAIAEGRSALEAMRSTTTEGATGLVESLRLATEDLPPPPGMAVEFSVTGEYRELHPIVRDELWQIAFEAIRNAVQHSQATQLRVTLHYSSDFVLRVKDDGVGMTAGMAGMGRPGHFGLTGMRERSYRVRGGFTIESDASRGTEVSIAVPGAVAYQATGARSILAALKERFTFSRRSRRD